MVAVEVRGEGHRGIPLLPRQSSHSLQMASINFTIPNLPPSMNVLYEPTFRGGRMTGMKMKDGARRWQEMALFYIPQMKLGEGSTLRIDMEFNFDFSKRRFDCSNLCKLVVDTIAKRLGINDKIVRHGSWYSLDSEKEFVSVTVEEILS